MLDINLIRENPDKVKEGISKKNADPKLVDKLLRLDEAWRDKTTVLNNLKADQNKVSRAIAGKKKEDLLSQAQLLKKQIAKIQEEEADLKKKRDAILVTLPNLPFEDVPLGKDDSANVVLREVGEKPKFKTKPRHYIDIAKELGLIDTDKAASVSGTRFGYLLGDAALLEFALVQLAFDLTLKEGFKPIIPPVMIKPEVFAGMGRLAPGDKKERYFLPEDNLYLVGSAEHTIGPFHMNDTLEASELPKRYVGFSTCFRREAGSYGKDTKGILRVHQFDKVEMFSFAHPDKSEEEHKFLLSLQEKLMQKLELPYRVVEISTGDMGFTDARQYDIETWFPGEGKYRETHSASNTTDFQARGMNVKYRVKNQGSRVKSQYVHMLNATAFAIGRTLIAIIENYQTAKGTVLIPKALQEYMGKKEIKGLAQKSEPKGE